MLLNNKFGIAIGICNQLSLRLGELENKEHYHEKYTQKWCVMTLILIDV